MSSDKVYDKNLELLSRFTPVAALFARDAPPDNTYVPETDGEQWFSSLDLEGINVLYCFGLGAGTYYLAAREWLRAKPNRYLVFCEDNLSILQRFLHTTVATDALSDKRVRIRIIGEPHVGDELLHLAVDYFARLPCRVTALSSYEHERSTFYDDLKGALYTMAHTADVQATHSLDINHSFYGLFYPAVRALANSYHGSALFDRFKGVPAIICGAGPSLDKQLPLLAELGDRALIFGGGSGFTALTRAGLRPHFGAAMSPAPDEVDRFWQASGYEIPTFWKFRLAPDALDLIHGPRLYQSRERNTGIISWLEEELGIPHAPNVFEGPSIIYYLTTLAHFLGCDPVIYVGVDLALTGEKFYSESVTADDEDEPTVSTEDIHGNATQTYWKWLFERHSLGFLVTQRAPTRYINSTEGGLGIDGVPNRALSDVADEHLTLQRDLWGMVRANVASVPLNITPEAIEKTLGALKESLTRCIALVDQMVDALERLSDKVQAHVDQIIALIGKGPAGYSEAGRLKSPWGDVAPWLADGQIALLQMDLDEEPAWVHILKPMIDERTVYHRRIYDEFIMEAGKREAFRTQRRLNIEEEHFLFLQKEARTNLNLI